MDNKDYKIVIGGLRVRVSEEVYEQADLLQELVRDEEIEEWQMVTGIFCLLRWGDNKQA